MGAAGDISRRAEVDRIETGGMNFDHDLFRARNGIGDVGEPDMIGDRAIGVENKGSHAPSCGAEDFYNTA